MACKQETSAAVGLCPNCWSEMAFIYDLACPSCGTEIIGDAIGPCQDCLENPPPWRNGFAVSMYSSTAARVAQSLKHGDRLDLASKLGAWMAEAARPYIQEKTLVVPIPAHWRRVFHRKYNQSEILARVVARTLDLPFCGDLLHRIRHTKAQKNMTASARSENLCSAFSCRPRSGFEGYQILLVDDVMTTGATLREATSALQTSGYKTVDIAVFSRVALPENWR